MLSMFINSNTASSSNSGTLPSQTVTNPREHVNAITTRSGPEPKPETSLGQSAKPSLESTAQCPPPEEKEESLMKVKENNKHHCAQHSRFLKMFKQLHLEIGLKDALVEMPKLNKWLSGLLRNKEKLEETTITTFAEEIITLPSRNDREFEEYLSLMTMLCEISTSRSQENIHANQSSIIESLPVEDSEPVQEEIDIFLVPNDLIPPGVENDDSDD
ncbi:hypothetical protein Tco_0179242 [Tanacetum coccineum]